MALQPNTTTAAPADTAKSMRFELPSLDLQFGSLTDGTNIPPPLPSPIEEEEEAGPTPPDTPATGKTHPAGTSATSGGKAPTTSPQSQLSSISTAGTKRRADEGPASPTTSSRPGSIRRLFSRGLLHTTYNHGDGADHDGRPQSRGGNSIIDSRKARRSSGWFGRLRSNEGTPAAAKKHAAAANGTITAGLASPSPLSPRVTNETAPPGPPPPMIPELSELNTELGIQGDNGSGTTARHNLVHHHARRTSFIPLPAATGAAFPAPPRRYKSGPYGYTQAKTLVFSRFGEPADVLSLHTHSISPALGRGAALVRTLAAPVNPADVNTIQGTYGARPPFQSLLGTPEPAAVPGNEGCFEVVGLGEGADAGLRKGDWLGRLWGLRSINVVRERATPEETAALKRELEELGATVVVTEAEFLDRSFSARLKEEWTRGGRDPVMLGLNCVGGKSASAMVKALSPKACMVTYGGMSRQSFPFPTGPQIFKRLRFEGFWLSEWNKENPIERRKTVDEILELMRDGKFKESPFQEVRWDWDTDEKVLKNAVQGTLEGFRSGKGLFVFGDT
ncbi:NAD(P)-binding protein [Trichocladium antarcticum]|uniref:NAD(P)-binding protein n=1 Tax=Trichocladium antarcticum TaxID=1450529 RepID=A0AAN6UBX8_9PEZI|nr:NAD(P)-binding protein [Trichocladium antarcticum]